MSLLILNIIQPQLNDIQLIVSSLTEKIASAVYFLLSLKEAALPVTTMLTVELDVDTDVDMCPPKPLLKVLLYHFLNRFVASNLHCSITECVIKFSCVLLLLELLSVV